MPKRLFDTSFLIDHWRAFPAERERTSEALRDWARQLIETHSTNFICTPVLIEILAGTRNQQDLALHRAYLSEFDVIDQRRIPATDWDKAQQLAQRVPSDREAKARNFGDCLIRAIAERLHCEVLASDRYFRSHR